MVLMKNKKGIFFTIFVIIILSIFILGYSFSTTYIQRKTTENRISTLNNFVFSIEEDLPRQLYISAFRIIFLIEKEIIKTGNYPANIDDAFNEAFYNGTILGTTSPEIQSIMNGATLTDIENSIRVKAAKINANITIISYNITISQDDPWSIKAVLTSNIYIKDLGNLASWNKTDNITAYIPVEGFEDPLYIVNTNGLVSNKIKKSPYEIFVSGTNIQNLSNHSASSYYIASTDAPSFLDKLEGKITSNLDGNGIESLVNLARLSAQGITLKDKSVVDHLYFSSTPAPGCNVNPPGMPSWFKIDNSHLTAYNVTCT